MRNQERVLQLHHKIKDLMSVILNQGGIELHHIDNGKKNKLYGGPTLAPVRLFCFLGLLRFFVFLDRSFSYIFLILMC